MSEQQTRLQFPVGGLSRARPASAKDRTGPRNPGPKPSPGLRTRHAPSPCKIHLPSSARAMLAPTRSRMVGTPPTPAFRRRGRAVSGPLPDSVEMHAGGMSQAIYAGICEPRAGF